MSRRDIINYYIPVQNQYFEMLGDIKDYEEAHRDGFMDDETYNQAMIYAEQIKEKYEELTYIILLLNEPNRPNKKAKFKKQNKKVYDYLSTSDCYINSESDDVLKKFKELRNNIKEKNNG